MSFHNSLYRIGCPVWACDRWKGSVFSNNAPRAAWLNQYSKCFNCVEGNSTFYGIPEPSTFERWAEQTEEGFQFCLKFPRTISHEAELVGAEDQLKQFLVGLAILAKADRLGPTFLQLSPSFDRRNLDRLTQFLDQLPKEFPYAVEVRHPDWFKTETQKELFDALQQRDIDRVIFDSRPLFIGEAKDEYEVASRKRKPRIPIRTRVTGKSPMLRLIGRNDVNVDAIDAAIEDWSEVIALWIGQGLNPIVFTHTPNDQFAPGFALRFHNRLIQRLQENDSFENQRFQRTIQSISRMPHEPVRHQGTLF